jgi:hypothetical protein
MNAVSGMSSRLLLIMRCENITHGSAIFGSAAIASGRASGVSNPLVLPRLGAAAPMAPSALLRTSGPCCSSSADLDVVELQLKVFGGGCKSPLTFCL